ncbi:MAG TPA: FAD-dependent oxidoreductase [Clostridia bacterium]|nr:FAD-dependent oxidoreductase [Clostridia bacterium]
MNRVVVVGGGWAGCAAAIQASKQGGKVILIERTDMLLGSGLVGGIMRNNGRYTATEEMLNMGGGELFELADNLARHRNIDFPGHLHATLYDTLNIGYAVEQLLNEFNIHVMYRSRVSRARVSENRIYSVITGNGERVDGEVFIDTTGTAGPMKNCIRWGNGCAMCIYRCPSFGGRISLTQLAGIEEIVGKREDGTPGAMSGACKLFKESLGSEIRTQLNKEGVVIIPVPYSIRKQINIDLNQKVCQQYNLLEFSNNIVLLDTGHAKMMATFFPLEYLREIPGLERARMYDPYSGGIGNSIRFCAMAPRDNTMKVEGIENLYCAGEKSGLLVGHTEAICTGVLAGYNAVRLIEDEKPMVLPSSLTVGDAIEFVNQQSKTEKGLSKKYTFSGSVYFQRMKRLSSYTKNRKEISQRVYDAGCYGVFGLPKDFY